MAEKAKIIDFLLTGYRHPTTDVPLSGGKVYTYSAGTLTAATTWTDRDKTTPATNPVVLDSSGRAEIYGDGIYTFVIKDASGASVETIEYAEYAAAAVFAAYTSVANLAALQAASGAVGDVIYMVGRTTSGDGGEGIFRWDSSDLSSTLVLSTVTTTTVNDATETCTSVAHGLVTGDAGISTTAVNGLSTNTVYWIVRVDDDNFKLATSYANAKAGTAIDLTGTTNFSVKQLLDPMFGFYVTPPSDLSGASGAWVRDRKYDYFYGGWFGITDGMASAATAFQAFLSTVRNRLQASFWRIPAQPLATVEFPKGSYTITETIVLKSLCDYNFGHSKITFSPSSADNLFEVEPSWSLATYPTGMNCRVRHVYCEGDYERTTDTGNAYCCFYFPITSQMWVYDFAVGKFEVGLQYGQDSIPPTTTGNYYNMASHGEIVACRKAIISNSAANYFSNLILRTSSGVYASPPAAFIVVGGTGNIFSNCDIELGATSGITTLFDTAYGVSVLGGYSEGGTCIARVDASLFCDNVGHLVFEFAKVLATAIVWYNDTTATEKNQRTDYVNVGRGYGGSPRYEQIKYNHVCGEGISMSNYSGPTRLNLNGQVFPYFTCTLAGGYIYLTVNLPSERFQYLHFITYGEATNMRFDNSWGLTAYSSTSFNLITKFEDAGVWHYSLRISDYTMQSGILKMYNDTGLGLLNVYFSNSPYVFSTENKVLNYGGTDPTDGTWLIGDTIKTLTPAASGTIGRVCTTAGTSGTLAGVTTTSTNGSATITVNDSSALAIGDYVKLAAHAQVRRIKTITGTTVVMDGVFYYTGASTLDYSAPVFKTFGAIAA